MATEKQTVAPVAQGTFRLSLDWWSVLTAIALALLVLVGIIPNVGW